MTRAPLGISEELLIQFAVAVVLVATAVAFVAYVWTWIAATRQQHQGGTDEPSEENTSDLGACRDDRAYRSTRGRAAVDGRSNGRAREGAGSLGR